MQQVNCYYSVIVIGLTLHHSYDHVKWIPLHCLKCFTSCFNEYLFKLKINLLLLWEREKLMTIAKRLQ
jgi:hypothetical protein